MKPLMLYFYPNEASYVEKDVRIFSEKFRMVKLCVQPSKTWRLPFVMVYQKLLCLYYFRAKYIVSQFAGYHSYIPVLIGNILRIKTIIILGGSDCANFPEINYGNYRKKLLGYFTAKSIEMAKVLSPVHEKMIGYDYTYENYKYKRQGYSAFTNKSNALVKVIYNGFYTEKFERKEEPRRKDFIAIAAYNREIVYQLKGIDLLEKAAIKFPNTKFTVVGVSESFLSNKRPGNLIFLPFVNQEELVNLLNQHYFYSQLSISEGFPNALCEAMLCGCIPMVSNVCSMPDIVADKGFVLNKRDEKELFDLIQKMLDMEDPEQKSLEVRKRVVENYSFNKRQEALWALCS